ncbi:MAG: ATP-binding protein, partial [Coprobacillus sp.]
QYAKNNDIEGLLHYLGQYQEEEDKQYIKRFCENDMVNNILLVYMQKALESNIDMKADALLDNDVNIKESDFVSILGNILENCIHGCLLYDGLDKYININIYMKANKVVIICKNSSHNDITFINGIPQSKVSTGIGIKSIIHAVSKYDGEYDFSIDNHVFTTRILLNVD